MSTKHREVTPLAHAASLRAWNTTRVGNLLHSGRRSFDFFTAGSSGRAPESLLTAMSAPGIDARLLVDIRAHPFSRHVPEWNQPSLARVTARRGVDYLPRPDLGVPVGVRGPRGAGAPDYPRLFRCYDDHVATPGIVASVLPLLARRPVFLCTELGPEYCHRHRLALAIEQREGMASFDL